jgi:ribosomal protein L32
MAVPKKKTSKSRSKRRHAQWQLKKMTYWKNKLQLNWSEEGKTLKLAHTVCPVSWYYNGKQVMTVKSKENKNVVDAD